MSHPLFASFHTKTVQFPDYPGETVTIRRLGNAALREAERARQMDALGKIRELGSAAQIYAEMERHGGEAAVREAGERDPFLGYDEVTLVQKGLVAWTLSPKPTSAEIADLPPEVIEWLARQIFEMGRPRTEGERGEG